MTHSNKDSSHTDSALVDSSTQSKVDTKATAHQTLDSHNTACMLCEFNAGHDLHVLRSVNRKAPDSCCKSCM